MLIDEALNHIHLDDGTKFAMYLIQYANPETRVFSRTYKQIQNDLGISQVTIARYFKTLEDSGKIIRSGVNGWKIMAVIGSSAEPSESETYMIGRYQKKQKGKSRCTK